MEQDFVTSQSPESWVGNVTGRDYPLKGGFCAWYEEDREKMKDQVRLSKGAERVKRVGN